MGKWTLRQQRTRQMCEGDVQEHTAAMRATRYVRRHANEFHGAGVQDAVAALVGIYEGPTNLFWPEQMETANEFHGAGVGDAVRVLTPLEESLTRFVAGVKRMVPVDIGQLRARFELSGPATVPVCLCTHPRSTHNVNGLCIALPGVLGCGCLGWSEKRS